LLRNFNGASIFTSSFAVFIGAASEPDIPINLGGLFDAI